MQQSTLPDQMQERIVACADLIQRCGASQFQLRYSDDERPVIWMAVAIWDMAGDRPHYKVGAAIDPDEAALRLLESVVDGGTCQHCKRPTVVSADFGARTETLEMLCWYTYDPELKVFRRSCEGEVVAA